MASTSTNKQPLLVDRVLHYSIKLTDQLNNGMDVEGNNAAELIVDATATDGAIIEDIYCISRSTTPYTVNLYLSTARDYLRPNQATYIGTITSATTEKNVVHWEDMPRSLAPVPQVGDEKYNNALYIPKGKALWVALDSSKEQADGPIVACQGGWY